MLRGGCDVPQLYLSVPRSPRLPYPNNSLVTLILPRERKPHPVTGFLHLPEQDGELLGAGDLLALEA